jgi:hypothetical protein
MTNSPALLAVHGVLFLAFGALLIGSLRTLRRMEFFAPAYGARRVTFNFQSGSPFPSELLPPPLRAKAEAGSLFILFSSPHCAWCDEVIPSLKQLASDYPKTSFLILTDEAWKTAPLQPGCGVDILLGTAITKQLQVTQQPFGMRVEKGVIVDFGIVNSLEHVESLL